MIRTLSATAFWKEHACVWLETTDDRSAWANIRALARSVCRAPRIFQSVDLVHIHFASATSFWRKSIFLVLAHGMRKKVVAHIHPFHFVAFFEQANFVKRWCLMTALGLADGVIVLSARAAAGLKGALRNRDAWVIPNPVPEAIWSGMPTDYSRRPQLIMFAGKLMDAKGCRELLAAFAQIAPAHPGYRLVLAGHDAMKPYAAYAEKLNIRARVDFPGWMEPESLYRLMSQARVFCLPSYSEGMPMSMLEAMALGCPVVTTAVGGIPEVIRHGENGLLIPPRDVEQLALALTTLLDQPLMADRLAVNARAEARQKFGAAEIGTRLGACYAALVRPPEGQES